MTTNLSAYVQRLRDALTEHQWDLDAYPANGLSYCIACHAWSGDGHNTDCWLKALLAEPVPLALHDAQEWDGLLEAAKNADWMQVVLNQGPPCFHLEGGKFCLRAERWDGHHPPGLVIHEFVSLAALLANLGVSNEQI